MARIKGYNTADFLHQHPYCVFCGGTTAAMTRDHVPSRQLFHNRHWPEGYEFPACEKCNSDTAHEEQVMALLARIYPDGPTADEQAETKRIMEDVAKNYPDLLLELKPTARQVRIFLRERDIPKDINRATSDYPIMSLSGPIVAHCAATFARKLFLALHYKHTEHIVPLTGGIAWRWYTNVQALEGEMPDEVVGVLGGKAVVQRANRNLGEQFDYIYGIPPGGKMAAYMATFRFSFAMLGFVSLDTTSFPKVVSEYDILRPLKP